jgi:hypothetical protein
MSPMKIAHLVNPVHVAEASDLFLAQPVTFESLRRARAACEINVELCAVCYPEDRAVVPDDFHLLRELTTSVRDVTGDQAARKLPLLRDLVECLVEETGADLYIYSNVDIAVMPYFYSTVVRLFESGIDAIALNRTTIADTSKALADIALMYAERGARHEGIDCFVFRARDALKYVFHDACLGVGPVGQAFALNQVIFSQRFRWLRDAHLTFHLGDQKSWTTPAMRPLLAFNFQELRKIALSLMERLDPKDAAKGRLLWETAAYAEQLAEQATTGRPPHSYYIENPYGALPKVLLGLISDGALERAENWPSWPQTCPAALGGD